MPSKSTVRKLAKIKYLWFAGFAALGLFLLLGLSRTLSPAFVQRQEQRLVDLLQYDGRWFGLFPIAFEPMPTWTPLSSVRAQAGPASGPLRVHPTNPRYFMNAKGELVYLTGSHTWSNLQDAGDGNPPPVFDYDGYLDFLVAEHHNFFRLWVWEQARWGSWISVSGLRFAPHPYLRTGPGTALDGDAKFDLSQFNQAYFDRMRQRIEQAGQRGIYVSVMLFDGWSIESKGFGDYNPWDGHPFNQANNINGINGDLNGDGEGLELQLLTIPAITALQEAYVRKVIDTVNDLDNVLYEISNESNVGAVDWQYHMINFIKSYEAVQPKQHPVGMTVQYPWPDGDLNAANDRLFASPADWISPAGELHNRPVATGDKVILSDTDHLCGICGDRHWVWGSFTRGENPIFMDVWDCSPWWYPGSCNQPIWPSVRENLGYTSDYAHRMNLVAMTPRPELASTGYALANPQSPSAEYLIYSPNGGPISVDLSETQGTLNIEWFNPATGEATAGGVVNGGSDQTLTPNFAGDAVLYLYQQAVAPTYDLFVPLIGDGAVSASPPGPYATGQQVTLTAIPASGWSFSGWSGDFSSLDNPATITITADMTITATFSEFPPVATYTVTMGVEGQGGVRIAPEGPYLTSEVITLTALAAPAWTFTEWTGDLAGTTNPLTFTISANMQVTATFVPDPPEPYTVTRHVTGRGAIELSPAGPFLGGDVITVTARPDPDWRFVQWSGDFMGSTNPITYLITGNTAITATFAPIDQTEFYTIAVDVDGEGEVSLSPSGPYLAGQMITLTAQPVPKWSFVGWSGDINGIANPYLLTIFTTTQVTATFQPLTPEKPYALKSRTQGEGTVFIEPPGPYGEDQIVVLTATPAPGWVFGSWTGDLVSSANPLTVVMRKQLTLQANFYRHLSYLPLVQDR